MKKNKNLIKELQKYNILFEFVDGIYYLWDCGYEFPCSERETWGLVNRYRYDNSPSKEDVKKFSNKKERTRLRENLKKERFENAEIRDNKEDPWIWD